LLFISDLCLSKNGHSIKDYYKILKVGPEATGGEIKKSYRSLVHHFHPDKNPDNIFASDYFFEIQEAYEVLSEEKSRRAYDKERRLSGLDLVRQPTATPQELLKNAQILAADLRRMNAYRIDTPWLKSAVSQQLSTQNIVLLSEAGLQPLRAAFLRELTSAIDRLPYPFPDNIRNPMQALSALDSQNQILWEAFMKARKRKHVFQKWLPLISAAVTIGICLLMYWYGQR